jgi:glycosyltransferase involved in cell wall biosynthesis
MGIKIHLLDTDPRKVTDAANYPLNHGSFSEVMLNLNKALQELGCYAEPDDADFVGICDGLQVNFKYKDKPSFVINVWECLNTLPVPLLQMAQSQSRIFGLSNQITNLWHKYGRIDVKTVYGGCDTEFWQQTKAKSDVFTFLHVNSSNVRSGLDLSIAAFNKAFQGVRAVRLIIKDTNKSPKLEEIIRTYQQMGCRIEYISERLHSPAIRDLYSESHVCLNLLRATSFGMPLLECSACNCLCLTGDIPPTNELIKSDYGVLVPMKEEVGIPETAAFLTDTWGLLNCYPGFSYPEYPRFATYDVDKYADILFSIFENRENLSTIDTRTPIVKNWQWRAQAERLVEYLNEV